MGLDMYLRGEKYLHRNFANPEQQRTEDGFRITNLQLDLGYWRKHPNLHGYIVKTFAGGKDECQKIELDADQLRQIIAAVKAKELPTTEGFFFGVSDDSDEQVAEDVKIFEAALNWLAVDDKSRQPRLEKTTEFEGSGMTAYTLEVPENPANEERSVYYQASW